LRRARNPSDASPPIPPVVLKDTFFWDFSGLTPLEMTRGGAKLYLSRVTAKPYHFEPAVLWRARNPSDASPPIPPVVLKDTFFWDFSGLTPLEMTRGGARLYLYRVTAKPCHFEPAVLWRARNPSDASPPIPPVVLKDTFFWDFSGLTPLEMTYVPDLHPC
jgi:hypothetical protein